MIRSRDPHFRNAAWLDRAGPRKSERRILACPRCGASYNIETERCYRDGQRLIVPDRDPLIDRTIGHYVVFEHIGDGGLGRVYRAGNVYLEQVVALKVLFGNLSVDRSATERFRLEARAASQVRHENLVEVFDFGVTPEGLVYMVMEYLEGRTLLDVIRENRVWPRERIIDVTRQIARGLAAAHENGLVHRDLKPANVMLLDEPPNERVKILDFGLVGFHGALSEDPTRLTRPGELLGTPAYMSPEQVMGNEIDPRTDLYALGVILYQLVSGRLPFNGDIGEIMRAHVASPPPPIPNGGPLGKLAMQLLEKLPEHRPQTARQVIDALQRAEGPSKFAPSQVPIVVGRPIPQQPKRAAPPAPPPRSRSIERDLSFAEQVWFDKELDTGDFGAAIDKGSGLKKVAAIAVVITAVAGTAWLLRDRVPGPMDAALTREPVAAPTSPPAPAPMPEEQMANLGNTPPPDVAPPEPEAPPPQPKAAPPSEAEEPRDKATRRSAKSKRFDDDDYDRMMKDALDRAERAALDDMKRRGGEAPASESKESKEALPETMMPSFDDSESPTPPITGTPPDSETPPIKGNDLEEDDVEE
jgi:serine/threonine protein kinase